MAYDAGLRVRPQGGSTASSSFQEVLPNAPPPALMNFITTNTNGTYQFNTAGMTYGPPQINLPSSCMSHMCANANAGIGISQGRGLLPDYMSLNPGLHTAGGSAAINLYDGTTFVGGGVNIFSKDPRYKPSGSINYGYIFGVNDAQGTSGFLGGHGTQGGVSIPVFGRFNAVLGFNHSYGGATALEIGISPPGRYLDITVLGVSLVK